MAKSKTFKKYMVELRYVLEFTRTYALGPSVRGYVEVMAKNEEHAIKIIGGYIRKEKLKVNSPEITWFKDVALSYYHNKECYDYQPWSFKSFEKIWNW